MSDILACEDLATKAELQELRNQINQLLGQPEEEGSLIDVLGLGSLDGTLLAGTIFLAGTAMQDLQLAGSFGSNVGQALLKNQAQFVKVTGRGVQSNLNGLQQVAKANAGKAAIGAQGAKLASSSLGLVANLATIIGTLGLNIATVNILGNRIDQNEKNQLLWNQDYSNLINILSRNNQVIEEANADIETLQENIADQQQINSELLDEIESAQENIDELSANAEKQEQAYNELTTTLEDFKTQVAEFEADTGEVIEGLETTITDLESSLITAKTNIDTLYEAIENLSTNLADAEARITEQEVKITQLEIITSVQIAELTNLQIAVESDQNLTDARLDSLEAQIVLAKNSVSGGGGTSSAVRNSISNQQNKTLELMNNLAGNPISDLPDIQPYEFDNPDNPFDDIFNQLLPQITPGTGGDLNVDIDELSTRLNDDFTNTLTTLGIVGITTTVNDIFQQTTQEAIGAAAEAAACKTAAPGGCMARDIKDPILNGQNNVQNNISNILQGLDLVQGQNILNIVQDTNNFMKKAWSSTRMDKVLNVLNTVLAFHNALMLSRNLGQTLGDVASQALQFLGIRDAEDNPIDINSVIGNTVNTWITNIVGAETYANIQQSWTNLNRIMVAGQGILYSVQGIKNAVLEAQEIVGNWTAKIGNNLQVQGIFEDDSYPWMNENINFRNPFNKFLQKIDTTEEIVGQVNGLVSSGIEAQENFNELFEQNSELKTASQELQETLSNYSETKETEVAEQTLESASPEIENVDVVKAEG